MSTIQQLISNILIEINDPSGLTYLPPELTNYLNYGIRILRRTIFELRPRLLQEPPLEGVSQSNEVVFPKSIMRIVEFNFNHQQIYEVVTDKHHHNSLDDFIDNIDHRHDGQYGFILMGFNRVKITPLPTQPYPYRVEWVAGIDTNLGLADDTGLPLEWEDMIVEFATVRAGIRNGADVSGESSVVQLFKQQIEENISGLGGPRHSICKGYRSYGSRRNRY